MSHTRTLLAASAALALLAAGCATPPGFTPATANEKITLPSDWQTPTARGSAASVHDAWWEDLGDAQLTALIERALSNSHDVRIALANLDAARAYVKETGADLYPSVGLAGDGVRSKTRSTTTDAVSRPQYARVTANASWELDFWGKARQTQAGALADADKSFWALRAARLSLAGSIARQYIGWVSDGLRLKAANDSLETMKKTLEVTRGKAQLGTATPVDVASAESDVASQEAAVASLALSIDQHAHALALLTARPDLKLSAPQAFPMQCPTVRPGLPSELLQNRPDVREAEAALRSTRASVAVAYAAFFPSISLTGQAGTQSSSLAGLFGGSIWSLGLSLDLPVFDFGKRSARYERTQANELAALESYRKTAESAYSDVRDALSATDALDRVAKSRAAALEASQRALKQASDRYRLGTESFLTLLSAQRTANAASQTLVSAQADQLYNFVTLNEALGAGADVAEKKAAQ